MVAVMMALLPARPWERQGEVGRGEGKGERRGEGEGGEGRGEGGRERWEGAIKGERGGSEKGEGMELREVCM